MKDDPDPEQERQLQHEIRREELRDELRRLEQERAAILQEMQEQRERERQEREQREEELRHRGQQ